MALFNLFLYIEAAYAGLYKVLQFKLLILSLYIEAILKRF